MGPILRLLVDWTRDGARFAERRHPLGRHGVAAKQEFEIEPRVADFARLASRDSASTHAGYLFGLQFAVEKRLSAAALDFTLDVEKHLRGGLMGASSRAIPPRGNELAPSDEVFAREACVSRAWKHGPAIPIPKALQGTCSKNPRCEVWGGTIAQIKDGISI